MRKTGEEQTVRVEQEKMQCSYSTGWCKQWREGRENANSVCLTVRGKLERMQRSRGGEGWGGWSATSGLPSSGKETGGDTDANLFPQICFQNATSLLKTKQIVTPTSNCFLSSNLFSTNCFRPQLFLVKTRLFLFKKNYFQRLQKIPKHPKHFPSNSTGWFF